MPPGPVHNVVTAPVAAPLRVRLLPTHNGLADKLADKDVGAAITVSTLVVVQPENV